MEKKRSLEERLLSTPPELLKRFEEITAIVENNDNTIVTADEAEQRAIHEVRALGAEILQGWARQQSDRIRRDYKKEVKEVHCNGKKNSIGIRHLEKSR